MQSNYNNNVKSKAFVSQAVLLLDLQQQILKKKNPFTSLLKLW